MSGGASVGIAGRAEPRHGVRDPRAGLGRRRGDLAEVGAAQARDRDLALGSPLAAEDGHRSDDPLGPEDLGEDVVLGHAVLEAADPAGADRRPRATPPHAGGRRPELVALRREQDARAAGQRAGIVGDPDRARRRGRARDRHVERHDAPEPDRARVTEPAERLRRGQERDRLAAPGEQGRRRPARATRRRPGPTRRPSACYSARRSRTARTTASTSGTTAFSSGGL